jgi:CheY-like chemotaxis protein
MKANANILIAEDDFAFRDMLEDVLVEEGYPVFVARNGSEALGVLGRIRRPVLILLDMNMPVMDGMTFLTHLEGWPDRERMEVVIMSAAVEVEKLFGQTPGIIKALKKPFDLAEILVLADEFAARRATSEGASAASTAAQPAAAAAGITVPPTAPEE